jgi:PadR family transcriptional regulator PadR
MGEVKEPLNEVIESMLGEWKRGMLSYWTLALLLQRPRYGLEISKQIESSTQGKMKLGPSTVYQLLRRMEKRGLLVSRWERTTEGPPRAYYEPTAAGREVVKRFVDDVLMPGSPIAKALAEVTGSLLSVLAADDIPEQGAQPR